MNSFQSARTVEARAIVRLQPFLQEHSDEGRYVMTDKGRLSQLLQEVAGDVLMARRGRLLGVELKAEERHTGNLFLETWSNRNLRDPESHATRGSNPGWLYKTRADLIFYYFLDADLLYIISALALKRWAFGFEPEQSGRIWQYPERQQGKYVQMNETRGRLVPVDVLKRELSPPPVVNTVRQLMLDVLGEPA